MLLLSLFIVLIFVCNPLFQVYSYAGDVPLNVQQNVPLLPSKNSFWLWNFLGRLHPLVVHFPVSLLLLAAVLELFSFKNFHSKLRPVITLLLATGTVAALISVAFGLLLARGGDYNEDSLSIHQWTGIATAGMGSICLFLLYKTRADKRAALKNAYRFLILLTGVGVGMAGHFGAELTRGSNYLTAALPWSSDYEAIPVNQFDFTSYKSDTSRLNHMEEMDIGMQVKTIFAHNCYKCHGAEKIKGELRLDSKKMIFKGGEDGPVIVAGDPENSDLFRRISLPIDHKDVMPNKGKKLSDKEIATIQFWIKKGAPMMADTGLNMSYRLAAMEPRNPPLPQATQSFQNPVDLFVNDYFTRRKIAWPAPVDDKIYLRRIYLDIIGLLPSPTVIDQFIKDPRPDKRAKWVRQLLNQNDDYAMHWLTFWNDALRNDYTGTGYITNGRYNITNWLYQSLAANKPYNLFVQELISPGPESKGFVAGIKWRGVVNASQRTEMQAAQNVSQVFWGLNLKCASCHNSFISDWKLEDAYAFANIFADTTLEINRCDKPSGKYTTARLLWNNLGTINSVTTAVIKQQQLAQIITKPEDGRLYRTIVNRVWAQLMGRGLVEPVDVMDNIPWNQDLLDWLAFNFVENKTDLKELIYLVTTSNTYQLPSVGLKESGQVTGKDYQFTGMLKRRMSGEAFTDAVSQVIGPVFPDSLVMYNPFAVREPVKAEQKPSTSKKKAPKKTDAEKLAEKKRREEKNEADRLRAYQKVADSAILLYPRASLVVNNSLLTALGRPNRETVSTSRESQANLLQALELTNGKIFNAALKTGAQNWKDQYKKGEVIIKELYRKALGREPKPKEYAIAIKLLGETPKTEAIQDLLWAVFLSPEFQIVE